MIESLVWASMYVFVNVFNLEINKQNELHPVMQSKFIHFTENFNVFLLHQNKYRNLSA